MDELRDPFDTVIAGTGLCQSMLAAALAKAGKRILHLDEAECYGSQDASYTLQELHRWAQDKEGSKQTNSPFKSKSTSFHELPPELLEISRRFALSLRPTVIPAICPFVDALVASGVAAYSGFRLVEAMAIRDPSSDTTMKRIPTSKEDIFKTESFSLIEKRRLMKFIQFATGDIEGSSQCAGNPTIGELLTKHFHLGELAKNATIYGIAFCHSEDEPAIPALQRLRKYLVSTGRFGSSPFLVGQYGGSSELLQGYCRACAVAGGYYMLKQTFARKQDEADDNQCISIDLPNQVPIKSKWLVRPAVSSKNPVIISRAIIVLNKPLDLPVEHKILLRHADVQLDAEQQQMKGADTAMLCFPADKDRRFPAWAIIQGEGTFSCPENYNVVYLFGRNSAEVDPEAMLRPLIHTLLPDSAASDSIVFSVFYTDVGGPDLVLERAQVAETIFEQETSRPTELCDNAVSNAEIIFRQIVGDKEAPLYVAAVPDDNDDD